jgi:hypothetical protein
MHKHEVEENIHIDAPSFTVDGRKEWTLDFYYLSCFWTYYLRPFHLKKEGFYCIANSVMVNMKCKMGNIDLKDEFIQLAQMAHAPCLCS